MSDQPNPPPTVGRVVHFTLDFGVAKGAVRRADIVRVRAEGEVDLAVTLAPMDLGVPDDRILVSHNEERERVTMVYAKFVRYDQDGTVGTWRYPPVVR